MNLMFYFIICKTKKIIEMKYETNNYDKDTTIPRL